MREDAARKATRLLTTGSVAVLELCAGHALASVIGDHGVYAVTYDGRRFRCSCPAMGPCSHGVAVGLVVQHDGAMQRFKRLEQDTSQQTFERDVANSCR